MPVREISRAAEPEKLYEQQNHMSGKWPAAARAALYLAVIVCLIMLAAFIIDPVALPRIHLNPVHPRHGWPEALKVAIGLGIAVGLFLMAMLALVVTLSKFDIYEDHLHCQVGLLGHDIHFKDIVSVEIVPLGAAGGGFWRDLKAQFRTLLLTPHYQQVGHGNILDRSAHLVLVKVAERKWWTGYLLDVDNPSVFEDKLRSAVSAYRQTA